VPAPGLAHVGLDTDCTPPHAVPLRTLKHTITVRQDGLDPQWVDHLVEVLDEVPPILISTDGTIIDGRHRVAAAVMAHRTTIMATARSGTELDHFVAAVTANASHGLALCLADRRAAARHLLTADPGQSDRSVARICGLSPSTVSAVRREAGVHSGQVRRGADGKAYPLPAHGAPDALARPQEAATPSPSDCPAPSPKATSDVAAAARRLWLRLVDQVRRLMPLALRRPRATGTGAKDPKDR
jgi:hypothetical protein